jgi:arylformamidase
MQLQFKYNETLYEINTTKPIDISLGVRHDNMGTNCFYTDRPNFKPYQAGNFIGKVALGGACNVDVISFTPHGNGTHTECIGHITAEQQTITDALPQGLMLALLITVTPEKEGEDTIIKIPQIQPLNVQNGIEALIVRTLPNPNSKTHFDYSGKNPAYFSPESLTYLNHVGIKHLLCDMPSVDREEDGGNLFAHKAFFGIPHHPRMDATITELIYVDNSIENGLYLLDIQIASFQSDASPSRPILYEMKEMV